MARKKKATVIPSKEEIMDDEIVNPGDCCGNYLEDDESCKICEISDTCKEMTDSIKDK